jgi:hypothetical protein
VVTTKWPRWSAVALLVGAAIAFFAIAIVTNSLVYQASNQGRQLLGTLFSALVALAALAPVYWSSYAKSPTWGSNPEADASR